MNPAYHVAAIGIPASVTAHRAGDEIAVGDILEIRDGVRRRRFSEGPKDAMGRAARKWQLRRCINRWSAAMPQPNDPGLRRGRL
jgi:hypothetical protein